MQKQQTIQKQIAYPGAMLRIGSLMIDLTIISFILRPIMGMISLYLIRYFFAPNIEMLGMTINSFEDVRLLTTSDDFAKSITPTQFLGLTFSTFAIEFILISVYFIFCWMKYGQTIGKYILKMKVVDLSDYQKISFTRSALRYFGYIFGLISIVMLFFSKNRRVLQDYLGHTIVIKT